MCSQFLYSQWTYWASPQKGRYKHLFSSSTSYPNLPKFLSPAKDLQWEWESSRGCLLARCFMWTHPRARSCLTYVAGKCFGYSTFEALLQLFSMQSSSNTPPLGNQCGCKPIPVHLCISSVKWLLPRRAMGLPTMCFVRTNSVPSHHSDSNTSSCMTVCECLHQRLDVLLGRWRGAGVEGAGQGRPSPWETQGSRGPQIRLASAATHLSYFEIFWKMLCSL